MGREEGEGGGAIVWQPVRGGEVCLDALQGGLPEHIPHIQDLCVCACMAWKKLVCISVFESHALYLMDGVGSVLHACTTAKQLVCVL